MTHLICFDTPALRQEDYDRLYAAASPARQARAAAFRRREDALCCLAAEALLHLAMKRSGISPDAPIARTPEGKPYLPDHPDFHFSISHSGTWAVLAWGDAPVGVDVEKLDLTRPVEALARRYFAPDEQQRILREGPEAFYRVWTAKESYVKKLGSGLRLPPNSFTTLTMTDLHHYTLPGFALTLCAREDASPEVLTRDGLQTVL